MNRIASTCTLALALTLSAACSKDKAPNSQPEISRISAAPEIIAPGGKSVVAVSASDPDGDGLSYGWTLPTDWTIEGASDAATIVVVAPAAFGQTAIVGVTVNDGRGKYRREQVTLRTTSASDRSVTITSLAAVPNPVAPGGTIALEALAQSTATTSITYTWSVSDAAWTVTGSGASATLVAPAAWAALATVTVTADDGGGVPATAKMVVATAPTTPPTISALTAAPTTVGPGGTVGLSTVASGAWGLGVTYSWSIAGTGWTVSGGGTNATATAPLARSSLAAVTVTVTDSAGASASRTTWVATNDAPPTTVTAVLAGTPPLTGVIGSAVALDASGSSSSGGGALAYSWRISSAPVGPSAVLAPTGTGSTASFTGTVAGSHGVEVTVTDTEGASATASTIVQLEAASALVAGSGDAQAATVGTSLALPLAAVVQTASGAAAPGVPVTWRVSGGVLLTSNAASDANGIARATVKVGRIAGPGSVTVALANDPATQVTFTFTASTGAPAAIAVSAAQGTVATGALVRVRVVDAFGNEAPGGASDGDLFSLTATSATPGVAFGADVEGAMGTLVSGGGTGSIVGQLVGGKLDIRLSHTKVETITLSLKVAPGLSTPLPYSGWQTLLFDSANRGFATGWTPTAGVAPWQVVTGSKAATAPRAFGVELTGVQAVASGGSTLSYALGSLAVPLVRLDFAHEVAVTSAYDAGARCMVQPSLSVSMRSATGIETPDRPAPLDGWPVYDPCDGRAGFSTTTGFVPVTFDLTDAATGGFSTLSFELSNSSTALSPAAPASWYVDDVLVEALKARTWAGSTITVRLAPGAPASVALSAPALGAPLLRTCTTARLPWEVTARILDAAGNLTDESTLAFGIGWTGAPVATLLNGEVVAAGSGYQKVRFEAGTAVFSLADATNETVTVSLTDPDTTGLTLGGTVSGAFGTYVCHSTGTGYNWSDYSAQGTMNPTQAIRACETHYGAGVCGYWYSVAFPTSGTYNYTCTSLYRWNFSSFNGPCNTYSPATVTPGYWSNYYYSGGYYCTGCSYASSYGWVQTGTTVNWY